MRLNFSPTPSAQHPPSQAFPQLFSRQQLRNSGRAGSLPEGQTVAVSGLSLGGGAAGGGLILPVEVTGGVVFLMVVASGMQPIKKTITREAQTADEVRDKGTAKSRKNFCKKRCNKMICTDVSPVSGT
jgi:hypothetical protein